MQKILSLIILWKIRSYLLKIKNDSSNKPNINPEIHFLFQNAFKKPFPGTQHGFTGNLNGDHIDWILYRGKISIKDIMVVHDTVDGLYPSDHFPIYATFEKKNGLH